ncbi:GNAT family N-acetyltransferase [Spirosoma lituiforme]
MVASFTIRPYQPADYEALAAVIKASYDYVDDDIAATRLQVDLLHKLHPSGQLTAWVGNQLVGVNLTRKVPAYRYGDGHTEATAFDTTLFVEDAQLADSLYSLDLVVLPSFRKLQIGKALHEQLMQQAFAEGFTYVIGLSRLNGYHRYQQQLSAEEYVQKVLARELTDPSLTFNLQFDPRVMGVVKNCIPRDTKSCGYAVVLHVINPRFTPLLNGSQIVTESTE